MQEESVHVKTAQSDGLRLRARTDSHRDECLVVSICQSKQDDKYLSRTFDGDETALTSINKETQNMR